MIPGDVEGHVAGLGGGVGGRIHDGQVEALLFPCGFFQKVEGVGLDQSVGRQIHGIEDKVLTGPLDRTIRPVHRDGRARPAFGGITGKGCRVAVEVEKIFAGGQFPDHLPGIPVVGEQARVDIVGRIDQKSQIPFGENDFPVGVVETFVALAILAAGPSLFQVNLFRRHAQGIGDGTAHQGQPFGHGLAPHVLSDHQVPAIPVHHGANFRDVPVIQPEDLDMLPVEAIAQMLESFFHPVGQHLALPMKVFGDVAIVHGCTFQNF